MADSERLARSSRPLRQERTRSASSRRTCSRTRSSPLRSRRAFGARERAVSGAGGGDGSAQPPVGGRLERLTRRLRSVSQRLEGIEDGVDRLDQPLESLNSKPAATGTDDRLAAIEGQLSKLSAELGALARALDTRPAPPPREQERLAVDEKPAGPAKPKPKRKSAARKKS